MNDFVSLWDGGPKFRQSEHFKLGTDSVLLADFVNIGSRRKGIDLGCGSGILPLLLYALYPILLLFLLLRQDDRFLRVLLTPGISFVLLSIFRDRFNAPRPYEALDIDPLIRKNTKGHSFPAAMCFLSLSSPVRSGLFVRPSGFS